MSLSPTPGARSPQPSGDRRARRARRRARGLRSRSRSAARPRRAAVTNYVTFVGGKAGKANPKLKPVVIGMVNLQGGQVQVGPLWTPAVETAMKYVNASLGGDRRASARAEEVLHQER